MSNNKLLSRAELPEELTWDLSVVYRDLAEWEADYRKIMPLVDKVMTFKGHLADSAETLAAAIAAMDDMERLGEKVYVFGHLKSDEDTANSGNRALVERAGVLFAEISAKTAWFEPEIMAIAPERIEELLNSPEMAFYKRSMEELLRGRRHTLSEAEESVLGALSDVLGTPSKTFSMLNNADLVFPKITNAAGRKVELTHGNYIKFLESGDRKVRRRAFKAMFTAYEKLRNTFASTLDGTVKKHVVGAKLRHYPSALEQALFDDNVPAEVYRNLIKAVHAKLPALHKYLKLRARVLKLRKLDMYDIYAPLLSDCRREFSWPEAVRLVKAALRPLGEEYCQVLDRAFRERWVDVPECRNKRSGAYSSGCYDTNPYLLLNFNGTLNDVFTLAHELGHSMHSYYSNRHQEYHYADYSIFVAEVASTTNELLLHHYLYRDTADRQFQAYLLCHLIDEIRGTIYRQTMFAEFELLMHELSARGVPLSADRLSQEYKALNDFYYGDAVKSDPLIAMEWARIPHFYYNFYVYKYATGMSAALKLSQNILSGDPEKLERYFGFLKAGDSKDVLDIMADAGVNLATPEAIEKALEEFEKVVDQLAEKLN